MRIILLLFLTVAGLAGISSKFFGDNEYGLIEGLLWFILAELNWIVIRYVPP